MAKKSTTTAPAKAPETMVERLTRLIDAEEKRVRIEKDPSQRQTAVRTLTMLCAELRKAEKEARRSADELAEPEVVEWFRRLETTRRGRFLREMQAIDASTKRSGLA